LEVVEDAGPTFHRSLPSIGRRVALFLQKLSGERPGEPNLHNS
jgi:hypothetical protein